MQMLIGIVVIIALPFVLFFSVVGLAIFIWCWNRIGRYFINFGRWLGSWRNFIPLSALGILSLIFILVVLPVLGLSRTVLAVLLILFLVVTVVILLFAIIAWIVAFCRWFWPRWRKLIWRGVLWFWDLMPGGGRRGVVLRRKPAAETPPRKQPPVGGQPPEQRPVGGQPPKRVSWLGSFWALMMGKPSKPAQAKVGVEREAGLRAAPPPSREKAPPRQSWFGTFWGLMLGKPSKPKKPKPKPAKVQTTEQTLGPSASMAAEAKTEATTRVTETSTTPEAANKAKPAKKGPSGGIWASIVGGITFVVGLVFLGVVWVVQRVREGFEWIRERLNLD